MKTNVLHIIDSLRTGGAETIAVNTVNALNSTDTINAFLCATREEGDLINSLDNYSKYIFLHKKSTFDLKALKFLKSYIVKHKIEVIHAHSTSFFTAFMIKLKLKKIKIVWHNHSGANINLDGPRLWILKRCVRNFSAVINVNDELHQWTRLRLKFSNSYKLNNYPSLNQQLQETKLFGESDNKVVCVAGFRPEKDHLNLLKAFQIVLNSYPNASLHLIGKDSDDEYSHSIKQFLIENKLLEKVFIYGNRPDIYYILKQANIGVLSSSSEGLPLSLLEYGKAALPVVVTNVGDCTRVVDHMESGLVVNRGDHKKLADAMLTLLNDKMNAQNMGEKLKAVVEENYSKEQYINKLIAIYRSLK